MNLYELRLAGYDIRSILRGQGCHLCRNKGYTVTTYRDEVRDEETYRTCLSCLPDDVKREIREKGEAAKKREEKMSTTSREECDTSKKKPVGMTYSEWAEMVLRNYEEQKSRSIKNAEEKRKKRERLAVQPPKPWEDDADHEVLFYLYVLSSWLGVAEKAVMDGDWERAIHATKVLIAGARQLIDRCEKERDGRHTAQAPSHDGGEGTRVRGLAENRKLIEDWAKPGYSRPDDPGVDSF